MALFNFFKKKPLVAKQPEQPVENISVDRNLYLFETFKLTLAEMGYRVEWHSQYLAIIVSSELEIYGMVVDNPDNHPSIMQLLMVASHPVYFPNGIRQSLIGIGHSLPDQVISALSNYINTTFLTIIDSFSDNHDPKLDFMTIVDGKEVLWHPKLGVLNTQGQWEEYPENESFFDLLKDKIPHKLTADKISWLKIYISKRADGTVIGECIFNNQPWEAGLDIIYNNAQQWEMSDEFKGLKQFIMFRRCDAYDDRFNGDVDAGLPK